MSDTGRETAQQRADQIEGFRRELETLETESVLRLDERQKAAIDQYHRQLLTSLKQQHDIDTSIQGRQLSLGMRVVSLLGALALAASVFFFFYQFWGYLGTVSQVVLLMGFPLISFVTAMLLAEREVTGYFSKLAAFLSFACFVLNISMLGQIFNIAPSGRAFLLWGLYALLLAYACRLRLLLVTALVCLQVFVVFELCHWRGLDWSSAFDRPEDLLLPSVLVFLLPLIANQTRYAGFASTYRSLGMIGFFITVWIMAHVGATSYLPWDPALIEGGYQWLGFALAALCIWLGMSQRWGDLINTGSGFFLLFLFTKFVDWWWDWLPKYLFFLILGLAAILALLVFKRLRRVYEQEGVA